MSVTGSELSHAGESGIIRKVAILLDQTSPENSSAFHFNRVERRTKHSILYARRMIWMNCHRQSTRFMNQTNGFFGAQISWKSSINKKSADMPAIAVNLYPWDHKKILRYESPALQIFNAGSRVVGPTNIVMIHNTDSPEAQLNTSKNDILRLRYGAVRKQAVNVQV